MEFNEATKVRDQIEAELNKYGDILKQYPRSAIGLPSEKDRISPEYQAAKKALDATFKKLRDFNKVYCKRFAKELKAERDKKRVLYQNKV
jgi:phage host-nuclease inhibitor protein Gam